MTLSGISQPVCSLPGLLAVGRSILCNQRPVLDGECPSRAADSMINTVQTCVIRQSALQHPSSGPQAKFCRSRRATPINNRCCIRGRPPGLRDCTGSVGVFLVHISARLKSKSKSCHGTAARAARPVIAHVRYGFTAAERRCPPSVVISDRHAHVIHHLLLANADRWAWYAWDTGKSQTPPRWANVPWCSPPRQTAAALNPNLELPSKPRYSRPAGGSRDGAVLIWIVCLLRSHNNEYPWATIVAR